MGFLKILPTPKKGMFLATPLTICLGEGGMAVKACQCGSQHFYISRVDKQKVEVTCLVCGLFYGALIPVLPKGCDGRWVMVNHN